LSIRGEGEKKPFRAGRPGMTKEEISLGTNSVPRSLSEKKGGSGGPNGAAGKGFPNRSQNARKCERGRGQTRGDLRVPREGWCGAERNIGPQNKKNRCIRADPKRLGGLSHNGAFRRQGTAVFWRGRMRKRGGG